MIRLIPGHVQPTALVREPARVLLGMLQKLTGRNVRQGGYEWPEFFFRLGTGNLRPLSVRVPANNNESRF